MHDALANFHTIPSLTPKHNAINWRNRAQCSRQVEKIAIMRHSANIYMRHWAGAPATILYIFTCGCTLDIYNIYIYYSLINNYLLIGLDDILCIIYLRLSSRISWVFIGLLLWLTIIHSSLQVTLFHFFLILLSLM